MGCAHHAGAGGRGPIAGGAIVCAAAAASGATSAPAVTPPRASMNARRSQSCRFIAGDSRRTRATAARSYAIRHVRCCEAEREWRQDHYCRLNGREPAPGRSSIRVHAPCRAGAGARVRRGRVWWTRAADAIRRLPAPLTAAVDVKLTGTVTFFNSALDQAWIQDATGGVRIDRIGLDPLIHVGDVVELTGRATMGGPAPIVLRESLRILSTGTPPPPIKLTAADVAA